MQTVSSEGQVSATVLCLIFVAIYLAGVIRGFKDGFGIGMGCLIIPMFAPTYYFYMLLNPPKSVQYP